jgi:starch phosphorylase
MTEKTTQASPTPATDHEHTRTGTSPASLKAAFQDNLNYVIGRPLDISTAEDRYQAIALSVRDRIMLRWIKEVERWNEPDVRQVSYLSAEFLVGPRLGKDLLNLGITENARQAMAELGLDLEEYVGLEKDPGLGNGGLGRLAASQLSGDRLWYTL